MKPSATQIFRSASPPTSFSLLGSCVFIGFLSWALIPMHYVVDFQVDWPKLLFKSRLQIPYHDIIHVATSISRRDINLILCSFQPMSSRHRSLVATSLYSFAGFNWSLMMSRHQSLVATSDQVFCSLQLVVHDVATSISCDDISLCLWRLHWLFSVSRLQSSVTTTASVKSASSFQTCHI